MLISKKKTYESMKLTGKSKYINSEYSNVVMVVGKSLKTLAWRLKGKSIKNKYNFKNFNI